MTLGNKQVMSKNIQRLMEKYGINRRKMSDDLNVSYTTLTDWIKGNNYPRIDKIELMAKYFHVSKANLVEDYISNTMLDSIYNASAKLSVQKQIHVLDYINGLNKTALSTEDKKELNIDTKMIETFSQLDIDQKNIVLGFALSQLQNNKG